MRILDPDCLNHQKYHVETPWQISSPTSKRKFTDFFVQLTGLLPSNNWTAHCVCRVATQKNARLPRFQGGHFRQSFIIRINRGILIELSYWSWSPQFNYHKIKELFCSNWSLNLNCYVTRVCPDQTRVRFHHSNLRT